MAEPIEHISEERAALQDGGMPRLSKSPLGALFGLERKAWLAGITVRKRSTMYEPLDVITDEAGMRAIVPGTFPSQTAKILNYVDDFCRIWIERSPFLTMATVSASGRIDVSPKGDPPGFVKVLDSNTLTIPDRPGNHRYDSFLNILETGRIGLCFFVPNRNG